MNHEVKCVAVDSRMCQKSCETLEAYGYELIKIPVQEKFDEPVGAHPDMSLLKLGNVLFINDDINGLFTFKSEIRTVGKSCNGKKLKYPEDVFLNCAVVGNKLVCNEKYLDKVVLEYAYQNGYEIISVKQGYAKCSTCVVNDSAIITEDHSIANACTKAGLDVLKIVKGFVRLNGYDYGFIGGCSGLIEDRLLAFNGNIFLHPDGELIQRFCDKHGTKVLCLCEDELYDVGSIIRL